MHLDRHRAGAMASIAAPALDVERKVARFDAQPPRLGARREELPNLVVNFKIGRGIRTQRARRHLLAHMDHLADLLEPFYPITFADVADALASLPQVIVVKDTLDQRGLARTRNAGEADEPSERNRDIQIVQVVFARPGDTYHRLMLVEPPLTRQRAHQQHAPGRLARAVRARPAPPWRIRIKQLSASASAARTQFDHEIRTRDHRRIVLDYDHRVAEVPQSARQARRACPRAGCQARLPGGFAALRRPRVSAPAGPM